MGCALLIHLFVDGYSGGFYIVIIHRHLNGTGWRLAVLQRLIDLMRDHRADEIFGQRHRRDYTSLRESRNCYNKGQIYLGGRA